MSFYAVASLHPELVHDLNLDSLEFVDRVYDQATDSIVVHTENSSSVVPRFDYNFNWLKNGSMNDGKKYHWSSRVHVT